MARLTNIFYALLMVLVSHVAVAQEPVTFRGRITGLATGEAISGVSVLIEEGNRGVVTDEEGLFSFQFSPEKKDIKLTIRHISYEDTTVLIQLPLAENSVYAIVIRERVQMLDQIQIASEKDSRIVSTYDLSPISSIDLPSASMDFNVLLTTLPGVIANNELSSSYNVRGGNYDENLVYINDILIYRPVLVRAGQQEGLSIVNPDLVQKVDFSTGGWQAKYGDKLSSSLSINYKKPTRLQGGASASFLGGTAYLMNTSKNKRLSVSLAARHKRSEYLLNTLETEGEYAPRYTDVQALVHYYPKKHPNDEWGAILTYGHNRYLFEPKSRETEFGTVEAPLRLYMGFAGKEIVSYDTWQGGIHFLKQINNRLSNKSILSAYRSFEREYLDLEAGYRLCDLEKNLASERFNECVTTYGLGTEYGYSRNKLDAVSATLENKTAIEINSKNYLEAGLGYTYTSIEDKLAEYDFKDSADYVVDLNAVNATNELVSNQVYAYVQNSSEIRDNQKLVVGARVHYLDVNNQVLVSPRIQYYFSPLTHPSVTYKFSAGLYHQPPAYREMRKPDGELNTSLKAQSSAHFIVGITKDYMLWGRPFILSGEAYYKNLWNVIPYDINNVAIRYHGENNAKAYAAGMDFRFSGEFVPGDESWFSLGVLTTREDVNDDGVGFIKRPSDQLLNVNIFFQDHIPNNPSFGVHVNFFFASGLPFGVPGDRTKQFRGKNYQRLDMGFSKYFMIKDQSKLTLSVEILNLTSYSNIISYYWVQDVIGRHFAIPNSLSQRFFNFKMAFDF